MFGKLGRAARGRGKKGPKISWMPTEYLLGALAALLLLWLAWKAWMWLQDRRAESAATATPAKDPKLCREARLSRFDGAAQQDSAQRREAASGGQGARLRVGGGTSAPS
eukprot:TRINITY_DN11206_c0_g1_i2.p1 TRINITY_DN11206_c0_g1~~TRINITY_DN11206_c0_g1_i2.p1  ORF type:complete len:109 (-),score=21.35 TRINITY_DN11206_c0_g1_i2:481-807(-)